MNTLTFLVLLALVATIWVSEIRPIAAQFDEDNSFDDEQGFDGSAGGDLDQQSNGQPGQEQQTLTLTRESLDALLQMLSPDCREQMEQAIGNNGDIAMECKREIQEGLMSLNIAPGQQQQQQQQQGGQQRRQQASQPRGEQQDQAKPAGPQDNSAANQAIMAIVGLVVVLFGGAAGVAMYRSKNSDASAKPAKKLSKKKEEKMRMKGAAAR